MRQIKITQSITTRDENFNRYISDICKEPMLTIDEEVELARRIHLGDEKALDKLVRGNLRFVISIAKKYQQKGISLMDLIDEGNIGLIMAARSFDETRGIKFISYAVWHIRQRIILSLAEQSGLVRIPLNVQVAMNKVKKAAWQFEQDNHYSPSSQELAEMTGLSVSKVEDAMGCSSFHISVDAPKGDDDDRSLLDTLEGDSPSADSALMVESLHDDLDMVLSTLTPREQAVIRMTYGLNCQQKTLEEISDVLGLSCERVRQIRANSIKKLRSFQTFNRLKAYA